MRALAAVKQLTKERDHALKYSGKYAYGYYAGRRSLANNFEWYYHERKRLQQEVTTLKHQLESIHKLTETP